MPVTHHDAPRVLSLSWRDIKAPKAGGAEVYTHEVLPLCRLTGCADNAYFYGLPRR